jgi:hypothetical protein
MAPPAAGADSRTVVRLRRLLLPAVLLAAVWPVAAQARPSDPSLVLTGSSAHFAIHYSPSLAGGTAQTLLGYAEQAYAVELGMGFPAPLDDGDGRIDIYVTSIANPDAAGDAGFDGTGRSSGWIELDPTKPGSLTYTTIVHELFHLIQYTFGVPSSLLAESTARWMEEQIALAPLSRYWPLATPLDCAPCDLHGYGRSPYDRWVFFAFLSDTYGPAIVREILASVTSGPFPTLQVVDPALRAHGSSLADGYAAFAIATVKAFGGESSKAVVGDIGSSSTSLSIDRLTTHTFAVEAGSVAPRICSATTLTVTVDARGGDLRAALLVGVPRFQTVIPFTGSAATGELTATMPWSPCEAGDPPILVLANGSDSSVVTNAEVYLSVGGGAQPLPTATGGLTVSLPATVTVTRSRYYLWAYVTVTRPGTLWVRGLGLEQEFPFADAGTHRIGITVPRNPGHRTLTFAFRGKSGTQAVSLVRTVSVRTG